MLQLTENLNQEGKYIALSLNVEAGLEIANPIYREVIPRELTAYQQDILGIKPQ